MAVLMKHLRRYAVQFASNVWKRRGRLFAHFLVFCLVLPWICHSFALYHSLYHKAFHLLFEGDSVKADLEILPVISAENEKRVNQAYVTLEKYKDKIKKVEFQLRHPMTENGQINTTNKPTSIAITIVSTPRKNYRLSSGKIIEPKYLTQNVARFLDLMNAAHSSNGQSDISYKLHVCDVGTKRTEEVMNVSKSLNHLPLVYFHHLDDPDSKRNHKGDQSDGIFSSKFIKEKMDYSFCIKETLSEHSADYMLIVEDDAIPKKDALKMVHYLIQNYLDAQQLTRSAKTKDKVAYFKLYHPKRLMNFISLEIERIPQLISASLVLGSVFYSIYYAFDYKQRINNNISPYKSGTLKYLDNVHSAFSYEYWFIFCAYVLVILLLIGNPHLQGWRRLSPQLYSVTPDAFCCTQGLLFPRESALEFSKYIENESVYSPHHKDDTLFEFQRNVKQGFLVQPNLFEHIGVFSSLRKKVVDPHLFIDS